LAKKPSPQPAKSSVPSTPTPTLPPTTSSRNNNPEERPTHVSIVPADPVATNLELEAQVKDLEQNVATLQSSLAEAVAANQKTELVVYNIQQVVTLLAQENRELRQQVQTLTNYVVLMQQSLVQPQPLVSGFGALLSQHAGQAVVGENAEQRPLNGQRTFLKSLLEQINTTNSTVPATEPKGTIITLTLSYYI